MAPIDNNYYGNGGAVGPMFHGDAGTFGAFFDNRMCSFIDLFNNAKQDMLDANGTADRFDCVGMVSTICVRVREEN